jgi:hypothetical protein
MSTASSCQPPPRQRPRRSRPSAPWGGSAGSTGRLRADPSTARTRLPTSRRASARCRLGANRVRGASTVVVVPRDTARRVRPWVRVSQVGRYSTRGELPLRRCGQSVVVLRQIRSHGRAAERVARCRTDSPKSAASAGPPEATLRYELGLGAGSPRRKPRVRTSVSVRARRVTEHHPSQSPGIGFSLDFPSTFRIPQPVLFAHPPRRATRNPKLPSPTASAPSWER